MLGLSCDAIKYRTDRIRVCVLPMVKTHPPFWHTLICQSDCVAACEALRFSATELRLRRFFICIVFLERDDPMKSSGKRALAFILCLILCIGLLQAGALAATPLTVTGITASKTTACVGETITWTATATGGSGTLQYSVTSPWSPEHTRPEFT